MSEVPQEEIVARARRARAFQRRSAAAETGLHLPSLQELFQMQPFCGGDMQHDAKVFAQRLMTRQKPHWGTFEPTRDALLALTLAIDIEACQTAAQALRFTIADDQKQAAMWEEGARRCEFYAAISGSVEMAWKVAGYCFNLADHLETPGEQSLDFATVGVGWVLVAAGKANGFPRYWRPRHVIAHELGSRMVERIVAEVDLASKILVQTAAQKGSEESKPTSRLAEIKKKAAAAFDQEADEFDVDHVPAVVVMREVGSPDTSEGKAVAKQFKELVNTALPLIPASNLVGLQKALMSEFPYAAEIINAIVLDLSGRHHVAMRPTIFVGPPGGGKTRFARRLLELLGIPHELYPCGGIGDASLIGTARRWSSGEPSLPLSLMRRHRCASPGVILDEVEKCGTSRRNGNLLDGLLGLMEPTSAEAWHDVYVQAAVDMRHVIWLGTANSTAGIPGPLHDRCRRFVFPAPQAEHLVPLTHAIMKQALVEQGLDVHWVTPLDQVELAALEAHWRGGSIRKLQQLVVAVLKMRDKCGTRH